MTSYIHIWPDPEDEPRGKIKTGFHYEIARRLLTHLNNKHSECIQHKRRVEVLPQICQQSGLLNCERAIIKPSKECRLQRAVFPIEETLYAEGEYATQETWESVRKMAFAFLPLEKRDQTIFQPPRGE